MNTAKTAVLMVGLTVLLVLAGGALGGRTWMIGAFAIAVAMNGFSYWFSDKIVLKMYKAQEVTENDSPEFYGVVRDLAARANLPMPKVYLIPSDGPNAFATGRNPHHAAVAATRGILKILNREELAGVMAHELAHVKNRDILIGTIAAAVAGAISMLATMAQFAMIFGGFGGDRRDDRGGGIIGMLAVMILAPIAANADSDGDFAFPRVSGRCHRSEDLRKSPVAGQRIEKAGRGFQADSTRCKSRHRAHVHRQPLARGWNGQPVQYASRRWTNASRGSKSWPTAGSDNHFHSHCRCSL